MIGWFPSPYPDELLYSICARYGEAMQYINKQFINEDLLGNGIASSMIDMPLHLEHLVSVLPPNQTYSVDSLVRRHTLFPFYAPFIPSERVEKIKEMMRSGTRSRVHVVAGINTGPSRPDRLRFCPACAEQDRKRYGETYWRRIHQLPGVEVCPNHMTFLESSSALVRNRKHRGHYVPAEQAIRAMSVNVRQLDREDKSHQILVILASDAAWLLNQNLDPDYESLRASYHTLLIDRGLACRGRVVNTQMLMQVLRKTYPRTLLVALQCDFDEKRRGNWVAAMFRDKNKKRRTHHPLRHLLLIQLLGYTAESFFAHYRKQQTVAPIIQAAPFGTGPYPCLNPVCQFFHRSVIDKIDIKQNAQTSYLPTGFFTCSCGFSYARRGPDQVPDDRLRYDWVRSYGAVWVASLKEMWVDQKISIIEMARRLKCWRNNIINKAISLGLPHPRCAHGEKLHRSGSSGWRKKPVKARLLSSPTEQQEEKLRLMNLYREQLLSAMRQQPGATRTILRKSATMAYNWLWRHDLNWLTQHLPPPQKPSGPVNIADWAGRDARLSQEVRRAAAVIKSSPERPVRVVKIEIARYLGEYFLLSNSGCLAKLPLTLTALNEVVETMTDFALRQIKREEERLQKEGCVLTFSKFAKLAGVNPRLWTVPEVKAAIEAALISLQSATYSSKRTGGRIGVDEN